MPISFCIAIVGAESTGKTTLARQLAHELSLLHVQPRGPDAGRRVVMVPELLREWCNAAGRTPRADEQRAIARAQHERIGAAAATHEIVVCDTTALMTAVYSRIVFGDRSLDAAAVALHREMSLTLLTALDLPWVGDGHQRDGPQVREPVDDALRELLHGHRIAYSVVAGRGDQRLAQALAALAAPAMPASARPADRRASPAMAAAATAESQRQGLFGRLDDADADAAAPARRWICDCCVPEAEQALSAL